MRSPLAFALPVAALGALGCGSSKQTSFGQPGPTGTQSQGDGGGGGDDATTLAPAPVGDGGGLTLGPPRDAGPLHGHVERQSEPRSQGQDDRDRDRGRQRRELRDRSSLFYNLPIEGHLTADYQATNPPALTNGQILVYATDAGLVSNTSAGGTWTATWVSP